MKHFPRVLIPDATPSESSSQLLAWPMPSPVDSPRNPRAKLPRRRNRKRRVSKLQLIISRDYIEEMKACAQSFGMQPRTFLYGAVLQAIWDAEAILGVTGPDLVRLSSSERASIASKYRPLNSRVSGPGAKKN